MNFNIRDKKMGLVNLFFLSFTDASHKVVYQQGHVVAEIGLLGKYYLVQLYSFLDGYPIERKLVRTSDLLWCDFYVTEEEWREAYAKVRKE